MGWTLPSTGMWRGEVFAISDCLVGWCNNQIGLWNELIQLNPQTHSLHIYVLMKYMHHSSSGQLGYPVICTCIWKTLKFGMIWLVTISLYWYFTRCWVSPDLLWLHFLSTPPPPPPPELKIVHYYHELFYAFCIWYLHVLYNSACSIEIAYEWLNKKYFHL